MQRTYIHELLFISTSKGISVDLEYETHLMNKVKSFNSKDVLIHSRDWHL